MEKTPKNIQITVDTDASGYSAGWIDLDGNERTIYWTPEEAKLNIAIKEALAIEKFVVEFKERLKNKRINFLCDNKAVVHSFEVGAKEGKLNDVIRKINLELIEINAIGKIEWVGTKVQKADKASRTIDIREEILRKDVYSKIKEIFNLTIHIDGMATFFNKKEENYISRIKESRNIHTDIFTYKSDEMIYIFPPLKIADAVFKYIIKEKQKCLGIFHTYQSWPTWLSECKEDCQVITLDKNFLTKHNLDTGMTTCSLIPTKKCDPKYGYYGETSKSELHAIILYK